LYFALSKNKQQTKNWEEQVPFIKVYSSAIEEMLCLHMLLSKKFKRKKKWKIVD